MYDPLRGLRVQTPLATGRSQSAQRLLTYVNAIHLLERVYDGFLLHSRGALASSPAEGFLLQGGAATSDAVAAGASARSLPSIARVRSDVSLPVLELQSEYDVVTGRGYLTRLGPSARYRRREIAGASHTEVPRWVVEVPPPLDVGPGCQDAVNAAPHHAVTKAALHALARWVREGAAPPQSPDIEMNDASMSSPAARRDRHGNALGGIRLPELEAPTAVLDGRPNAVAQASAGHQMLAPRTAIRFRSIGRRWRPCIRRTGSSCDSSTRPSTR